MDEHGRFAKRICRRAHPESAKQRGNISQLANTKNHLARNLFVRCGSRNISCDCQPSSRLSMHKSSLVRIKVRSFDQPTSSPLSLSYSECRPDKAGLPPCSVPLVEPHKARASQASGQFQLRHLSACS